VKILYISNNLPYPPDLGLRIRQFHILSGYARAGRVSLMFNYADESELDGMKHLEPYCSRFYPVSFNWGRQPKAPGLHQWQQDICRYSKIRPFLCSLHFSPELKSYAERIASDYDLIHVSRLSSVPHAESILPRKAPGQRIVLDLDDIETDKKETLSRICSPRNRIEQVSESIDQFLLRRFQHRALKKFDRIFVCSDKDRESIDIGDRASVVPNGADTKRPRLPDVREKNTLIFVATFGYYPNFDALQFFLSKIFPRIRSVRKDARLLVVGREMAPEILNLGSSDSAIRTFPDVKSVQPFYSQAAIAIAPIRAGGGTRLKILEAFAMGRPVVSTSIGCEGLDVIPGTHLLIADDPDTFAQSCLELMQDSDRRKEIIHNSRKLVEDKYSWDMIEKRIANLVCIS